MPREFCSYCGTVTNEGERMCQTQAEVAKCPWMGGVHRGVIVDTEMEIVSEIGSQPFNQ